MFGCPYEAIPYGLADVCSENPVFRVCKTAFIAMFGNNNKKLYILSMQ